MSRSGRRCEPERGGGERFLAGAFVEEGVVTGGRVRASRMGKRRAWVLIAIHLAIFLHILHWQLAGRTLSPLEPSESMYALRDGLVNAGAILMALSTLSVLVVGRFFCGWACHLVALQDLCAWMLKKVGIRPRPLRSRFLWLVPLGAALVMFGMPIYSRIANELGPPAVANGLMKEDFWETFPGFWLGLFTFVVCGFVMVWLLGSKGFCTYACPYGGVFGVADKLALGRIRVSDACKACGHCSAVCSSNVAVAEEVHRFGMVVDPGCMKCLDCVSVCPEDALSFGFGRPALGTPARREARRGARPTFGLALDLAMVVVFALVLAIFAGLPDTFAPWASSYLGRTPLLLALGLAALTAFAVACGLRALRGTSFAITGLRLRGNERITRGGLVFVVATLGWLLFCAQVGRVQYHWFRGKSASLEIDRLLAAPAADPDARAAQVAALAGRVREHMEAAREIAPQRDPRVAAELGELAVLDRDFATAARELQQAVDLAPDHANWRLKLAACLAALGRNREAAIQGRRAAELLPRDLGAHHQALRWAIFAQDWRLAEELATAMLPLLPEERRFDLRLDLVGFRMEADDRAGALALARELAGERRESERLQGYLRELEGR